MSERAERRHCFDMGGGEGDELGCLVSLDML
jgi:hypothetical protein